MDYNELFNIPSWDPRPSLRGLRDRGIRVVMTPDGLRFRGRKRAARPLGSSRAVEPAFRPRDEIGRLSATGCCPPSSTVASSTSRWTTSVASKGGARTSR